MAAIKSVIDNPRLFGAKGYIDLATAHRNNRAILVELINYALNKGKWDEKDPSDIAGKKCLKQSIVELKKGNAKYSPVMLDVLGRQLKQLGIKNINYIRLDDLKNIYSGPGLAVKTPTKSA